MIVGVITGTYSSVFVAAAVVTFWGRKRTQVAAEPASASGSQSARRTKSQRKVKAS
jgi:preprotein translocase subunit SecF